MADLTVKDNDPNPTASIEVLDSEGNATTADDVPSWASSDITVADVLPSDDGLSATINKTGKTGATMITVSSTRSSDGQTLQGVATLTVAPSEEATISLNLVAGDASQPADVSGTTPPSALPTDTAVSDPTAPAPDTTTTDTGTTDTTATDPAATDAAPAEDPNALPPDPNAVT